MANDNGINLGASGAPPIVTTQPERILRHSISDEELDMLTEARSDFVLEIFLIVVGTSIGAFPPALSAMIAYLKTSGDEAANLSFVDFVTVIVFWACLVAAVAVGIILKKRTARSKTLRDQIRQRTARLEPSNDQPQGSP